MKKLLMCVVVVCAVLAFPIQSFASQEAQPSDPGIVVEILSPAPRPSFGIRPAATKGEYVNIKVKFTGAPPATYFYNRGDKSGTLKRYQSVDKNTALYDGYIN